MSIHNAKIDSTFLGIEDHGIMTFFLHLSWDSCGIGYGGYGLDGHSKPERVGHGQAYQAIRRILETLGLHQWEAIKGQLCRVDFDDGPGCSGRVTRIGHILEDKWFDLAAHMRSSSEN
jgi:hypothetical protein